MPLRSIQPARLGGTCAASAAAARSAAVAIKSSALALCAGLVLRVVVQPAISTIAARLSVSPAILVITKSCSAASPHNDNVRKAAPVPGSCPALSPAGALSVAGDAAEQSADGE